MVNLMYDKCKLKILANCIRILAADAIEKAKSGHPGLPLGLADVMTVLAHNFLKFNPNDPTWFNRDRLILSSGHGSMLLYAFYYLAGYKDFDLNQIKQFRQLGSKTAGHPEYNLSSAIETTTGPLGQGFGNSVGMAIAEKKYKEILGAEICDHKIYCIVGEGCLMEGISYESASIAGHLNLNNLIVIFDDNHITIDGNTNLTLSENQIKKFISLGWQAVSIDGHDFDQIKTVLTLASLSKKPFLIACRTIIGYGSPNKSNTEHVHGAPLGEEEVNLLKQNLGFKNSNFHIPKNLLTCWRQFWLRNFSSYSNWQKDFSKLEDSKKKYLLVPEIDITNFYKDDTENLNTKSYEVATRTISGKIINYLTEQNYKILAGSADLSVSNYIINKNSSPIKKDNFKGNFIHYGIRENAMASIMNGLALEKFLCIGGTFLVFSDYMRPGIRLSAMMGLKVIYVMTHDSIGVGEDGPTHQPIEHISSLRCIPRLTILRPADYIETIECWQLALTIPGPIVLILTRQITYPIRFNINENECSKGAYLLNEEIEPCDVTLFSSGSEVAISVEAKNILLKNNIKAKVISVPSFELFFKQSLNYINSLLNMSNFKVGIEAACSFGWHRIIGSNGLFIGIDEFGRSAPYQKLYDYYGLTAQKIANKIIQKLDK